MILLFQFCTCALHQCFAFGTSCCVTVFCIIYCHTSSLTGCTITYACFRNTLEAQAETNTMHEKNSLLVGFGRNLETNHVKLCDKLTIYFQKQQVSGGCDVKQIQLQKNKSGKFLAALVTFEEGEAVNAVLSSRREHSVNIDGQEITLHVETLYTEEASFKKMEVEDSSLDSWVNLDPDLFPEVHSDDDLYSSSILQPDSPSSASKTSASNPSPVQSSQSVPAARLPKTERENIQISKFSPQVEGDQMESSNIPDLASKQTGTLCTSRSLGQDAHWQDTGPDCMGSHDEGKEDQNSPLSRSPKRPRKMDDFENEQEKSRQNIMSGKRGTGRSNSNIPFQEDEPSHSKQVPRKNYGGNADIEAVKSYDAPDENRGCEGGNSKIEHGKGHGNFGYGNRDRKEVNRDVELESSSRQQHIEVTGHGNRGRGHDQHECRNEKRDGHPGTSRGRGNTGAGYGKGGGQKPNRGKSLHSQNPHRADRQDHQGSPSPEEIFSNPPYTDVRDHALSNSREDDSALSATVEVSHFKPTTSEEILTMYFESKRRSGGGKVVDIKFNEDTATVTFADPEVAVTVVGRSHLLDGAALTVIPMEKKKSRPRRPFDRHRLLLTGIPDGTSEEKLLLFIESRTKIEDDPDIKYGELPGTAMVRYSEEIKDIKQVMENFKRKELQKAVVCASPVEYPDCILVQNLPPAVSEDAVELYFDSTRKSGGGTVRDVQLNEEKNQAIVFFDDWKVVDRVLQRQHALSKTPLDVSIYFDKLGAIVVSDGPTPHIPDPVILKIDPEIAEFVLENDSPYKARAESEIQKESGRLLWPGKGRADSVEIVPVDSANDPNCWVQWSSRVSSRLTEVLNRFKSENITVEEDIWNDVCNRLQELNLGNVRPLLKSERGTIILRGPCAEVENTKTRLTSVVRELEAAAERAKQVIKKTVKLGDEKFQLLFLCNIKEELDRKWQVDVRIMPSPSTHELIFEGMRSEVAEAQLDMYSRFDKLAKHEFEFSPNKVRFIIHVQDKVHEILSAKKVHAATTIDGNKITIYGATDQDTRRAYGYLQNDIVEASVAVQNQATANVLQTPKGRACFEEINRHKVALAAVNPDKGSIEITGFKVDVQHARIKIQDFIETNVVLQRHIPLVRGKVGYLMEHDTPELQSIMDHNRQYSVTITPRPGGRQSGIIVTGTEQGLNVAVGSVKSLAEKVVDRQYPVAKPGMPELLRSNKGKKLLSSVARECSCYIDSNSVDGDVDEGGVGGTVVEQVEILRRHTTNSGCELMVCKGDLTREAVDAIVNAANVDLNHIGGLAGDIVRKGGNSIKDESRDIIRKNGGPLHVAQAVFTGSGRLPCQHIIHVAGPKWERPPPVPGEDPTTEEDLLHDSVTSVLRAGSRQNLKSISIPAISSGVYGFPIDLCAKTVVEASLDFCRRNKSTSLKEIRFTNIDKRACDSFMMAFENQFGEERAENIDFGSFASGSQDDFDSLLGATSADYSMPSFSRATPPSASVVSLVTRDTVATKENKTITLKRGDIGAENAAVIVNTTGSSMKLNSGGVSNAIAAAAGPALQQECTRVMGQMGIQNVAAGDFIETGPGNLNCQNVFHAVCDHYRGPSSETLLRGLMQKILQQVNQKGQQSIAIPAIGTGNLAFPHDVAAQIMYDEVIKFSQLNPTGSLTDIRFVVYHQDQPTIKAFEDEMQRLLQQGPIPAYGQQSKPTSAPTRRLKHSKKGSSHSSKEVSGEEKSFQTLQVATDGSMSMQIGHITVQLQQGDLTKENTDAIVNSAGHDLNLSGPVSRAIVKAGGREIARECDQLVKQGHKAVNKGAVKTTAGRLPCRNIIHVVTPHSGSQLKNVVLKALQLADNDGLRSIAFPALGTGRVGGNAVTAAKVLLDAIGEFAVNENRKTLLVVKLTIFQPEMLSVFGEAMKSKSEGASYKPQKGFWRRGLDYMKNAFTSLSGVDDEEMVEGAADGGGKVPSEPDTLILHIYAGSVKNLEEAVERIEDFIKDEFSTEEIPFEQETWGELNQSKIDQIFDIARKNNVKIDTLLSGRAKRILVQGRAVDVLKAKADIQEMFTKIQLEEKKKAEAQLINKTIQWRYKDSAGVFVDYGDEINPIIERAHQANKPHVDLELEEGIIRINLFTMEERKLGGGGSGSKTEVHRADLKKEQTFTEPNNWIPMNGQNCVTAPLTQGSQEFVQVQTAFQNSLGRAPTIHRIERIQVLDLYKSYTAKKERIQAALPGNMQVERTLFHGTSEDTCDKINRHGFNRSYSGKNGTAHGKGTYFAKDAAYSDGYAHASATNNHKHMYMCKVLTGEYAQGNASFVSPPSKPNKPTEMYDCVVDNVGNPRVFVVFHDAQAYPEYLIVYN